MVNPWKYKLSKCVAHGGLRLVENRLFATAGAFITREAVVSITTRPPNSFTKEDGKIKFPASCEILELELLSDFKTVDTGPINPISNSVFVSREPPTPIIEIPEIEPAENIQEEPETQAPNQQSNNIICTIYDSDAVHGFNNQKAGPKNKLVKIIASNGKSYITIKRMGFITIPLSIILPNKEYTIVLNAKIINGNGKLNVGISCGNAPPLYTPIFVERGFTDSRVNVVTGQQTYPGEFFQLNIAMMDDGVGEVLISRVIIIENNFVPRAAINLISGAPIQAPTNPYANIQAKASVSNVPSVNVFNSGDSNIERVKIDTKNAAIIYAENNELEASFKLNTSVEPLTYSARQWVGKVSSLLKGLKVIDKCGQIENVEKTTEEASLVIGAPGFLKKCNKIFIEEWSVRQALSESDIEILAGCNKIITPSFVNFHFLKQALPNKEITCSPRLWPAYSVIPHTTTKYFIYFEKFVKVTEALVGTWKDTYSTLYIVGSTVDLINKNNICHLSEYLPYSEILRYVFGSSAIIDLSLNNNYMSGINNLAIHNKLNIITNNLAYFINEYANVMFINSHIKENDIIIETVQLQSILEQLSSVSQIQNTQTLDAYMAIFKNNILDLFGNNTLELTSKV